MRGTPVSAIPLLMLGFFMVGCDASNGFAPPLDSYTIDIIGFDDSLSVGDTVRLSVDVRDASGNPIAPPSLIWTTSDTDVVAVSPAGLVAAEGVGEADITVAAASTPTLSASRPVTVLDAPPPPPPPPPPDTTPLPPAGTALFLSDWSTATGSDDAALLDGGKWTGYDHGGGFDGVDVVSAQGLGFPVEMANVLRSAQGGGSTYNNVVGMGILPAPQAGEHRYYRWYERWDDLVSSGFDHGIELSIGDGAYAFAQMSSPRSSGVRLAFQFANADIGGGPNVWYDLGGNFYGGSSSAKYLQRQQVYRIELHVRFPTSNSVQMLDIRVYNQGGALVWDNDDFEVADPLYGVGKTLATNKPVSSLPSGGGSLWRNFHFGSNGQSGWPSNAGYRYYGGFRVSREGWNGPYTQLDR